MTTTTNSIYRSYWSGGNARRYWATAPSATK